MSTPRKLLLLSSLLRRRRCRCRFSSAASYTIIHHSSNYNTALPRHPISPSYSFSRSLSTAGRAYNPETRLSDDNIDGFGVKSDGFCNNFDEVEELVSGATSGGDDVAEVFLPVKMLMSVLDQYHHLTGFPWWVVIASSTLALRFALLPIIILQLNKLKKISESLRKLPPPLPPPLSGRSYVDQISRFNKARRAVGCPSLLWFLAGIAVQAPCFILGMTTIRKMSLDQHPGFDCGGALWFQNLTENPHGILGPIFPLLIATLHLLNVQVSFQTLSKKKASDLLSLLAQYYKVYLQILMVPILFIAFNLPQGSLVYWVTNSSWSLIQQLLLGNSSVRATLGLPDNVATVMPTKSEEISIPEEEEILLTEKQQEIPVENLSPKELFALSIKHLTAGEKERAFPLLQSILNKDPDYVRALIVMGQILIQSEQLAEATEYLERAISKLFVIGLPTEVEEVDMLILASQWAGVACIKQARNEEGLRHLERVASLKEPDDPKSKAHYYDAFLLLGSALYREGRKAEAANYLRKAVAYDSKYQELLDQCEKDEDDFASDLANSRRGDY